MSARKRSKCPRSEWLQNSISCILLTAKSGPDSMIDLEKWSTSTLTIFCAILPMTHKQAWPLHCQSMNFRMEKGDRTYLIIGFMFIAGVLIGFVIVIGCEIWDLRNKTTEQLEVGTER